MAYVPAWLKKKGVGHDMPEANRGHDEIALAQLQQQRKRDEELLERLEGDGEVVAEEPAPSHETSLSASNKGFQMLAKMGWKENTGLGKQEQGRVEPVRADNNNAKLGLGKDALDMRLANEATKERLALEIEKEMTEEDIQRALLNKQKQEAAHEERKEIKSDFFCDICNKQYKNAPEMENHLSSYDHHHKKRLADLKKSEGARGEEQRRKRQKREEERQERRVQEMAAAAAKAAQVAAEANAQPPQESEAVPQPPPPPPEPSGPLTIQSFSLGSKKKGKKRKL